MGVLVWWRNMFNIRGWCGGFKFVDVNVNGECVRCVFCDWLVLCVLLECVMDVWIGL